MLVYYQYYYSFSFIYFVILSLPCSIILALKLLKVSFCVLSFSIFSDVGFLCCLLWAIFHLLLVFYPTLLKDVALFKGSWYTYITVRFMCSYWLWMIQWHFIFLIIILMTYPWQRFLSSTFIVFFRALLLTFTSRFYVENDFQPVKSKYTDSKTKK